MARARTTASAPVAVAIGVFIAGSMASSTALALPPAPDLMARLAENAANFERMRKNASFQISGRMEDVDGDGTAGSVKEMNARMVAAADGSDPMFVVDRYIEDGEDKTEESRERAAERARDRKGKPKKREIRIPTHASEQANYVFDVVEVDAANPSRVKLSFVPREREEHTIEGSAWVDAQRGVVLSAGFKLARTSMFVTYVHVKLVFGADGPLGPAISKVEFEGKGGVLFVRKHFRGSATLSNYTLAR